MPLFPSPELSRQFGCSFFFLLEWAGPTGSHKDRWAPLAVAEAKRRGYGKIVVTSSGNQGVAAAAAANEQGIECVVVSYKLMLAAYRKMLKQLGATAILCADETRLVKQFRAYEKQGYFPLSLKGRERQFGVPVGTEGYHAIAREIVTNLRHEPDVVVVPTCFGDLAFGLLQGFFKLQETGTIKHIPRFILARARLPEGKKAYSIALPRSTTTEAVREVLEATNGKSIFVTDRELVKAQKIIRMQVGTNPELASAAGLAAVQKLDRGELTGQSVVAILTAKAR